MAAATIARPAVIRTARKSGHDKHIRPLALQAAAVVEPAGSLWTDGSSSIEARRILVVDDSPMDAVLAKCLLARDGHDVTVVEDGAAAVKAAAAGVFDLVLMDMEMPVLDGLAATRAIRALPAPACDVVIVALTANTLPDEVLKCVAAGMNGHLAKPAGRGVLRCAIAAWVRGPSKLTEPAPAPSTSTLGRTA